VSRFLTSHQHN